MFRYDTVHILDNRHLLFASAAGHDLWLNTLRAPCVGMRRGMALAFELRGNRICALDRVGAAGGYSPSCSLGEFQGVTDPQVRMIQAAVQPR